MSKYLIVGLGNIGSEYANTRHNIGFKVVEEIANKCGAKFTTGRLADIAEARYKGKTYILIKPSTYMNLSGKAVNYWMQDEKISQENVLVVTDDIALPFGTLRMKGNGGSGGHNGLKNIEQVLGNANYARLRFGVGAEFSKGSQVDYVLGEWDSEEEKKMGERLTKAADICLSFGAIGIQLTMTNFNGK